MGDQDVAVKIYPSHYRNYFQNERDTYCLPFMEHPSLLSYYGTIFQMHRQFKEQISLSISGHVNLINISSLGVDERTSMEGSVEYLLVLSFAPGGSLTDFLRTHIIDWPTFCKMSLSIVKGLAYLHTDIRKGGTHRTLPPRNM